MTRHSFINSIHKLAFGTLASIALFCSCRSSDIATRESSSQNHMQETISQDSVHVSQLRLDSVIVERYFTVETIRDTGYVARSDTIVREVEVIKEKEVVKTAPQRKPFTPYLIFIFASIVLLFALYLLIRSRLR